MTTPREYLVSLGLAKPGRGRFSREAIAALDKARAEGTVFDEAAPAKPVTVHVKKETSAPTAPVVSESEAAGVDPKAVREWAKDEGHVVSDRGRIPASVTAAYLAAKGTDAVQRRDPSAVIQEAPRAYPEGQRFRFRNQETGRTYIIGDRVVCHESGYSVSHCHGTHTHMCLVNGTDGIVPVEPV